MAIQDANKATFKLANSSGQLTEFTTLTSLTLDTTSEVSSGRHMTSETPTYWQTVTDFTLSGEGLWDTSNMVHMPSVGDTLAFELKPDGTGTTTYSGSGIVTAWSTSAQMDNAVTVSFSMQGSTALSHTP